MGSLYPILVNISDLNSDLCVYLCDYPDVFELVYDLIHYGYPCSLSSLNLVAANDDVV